MTVPSAPLSVAGDAEDGGPAWPLPSEGRRAVEAARVLALDVVSVRVLPWVVLGAVFAVTAAVWVFVPDSRTTGNGGLLSVYGYAMALAAQTLTQGFGHLVQSGATRRTALAGTGLLLAGHALVVGAVLTTLFWLERATGGWGVGGRFFRAAWLPDTVDWQLPWLFALPGVFAAGVMLPFAAFYLRWRTPGALALALVVTALLVAGFVTGVSGFGAIYDWFAAATPLGSAAALAGVGVLGWAASWLALRRAPV